MVSTESGLANPQRKFWLNPTTQTHIAQGIVAVFGAVTAFLAFRLGLWVSFGPGPGFFPFIMGLLLVVLAGLWVLEARRVGYEVAESVDRRRTIAVIGSLLVLALVLELVGFQLTMLIFLLFHLKVLGKQKWITTIIVSALGSFGAFALFNNVLGVQLPMAEISLLSNLGL